MIEFFFFLGGLSLGGLLFLLDKRQQLVTAPAQMSAPTPPTLSTPFSPPTDPDKALRWLENLANGDGAISIDYDYVEDGTLPRLDIWFHDFSYNEFLNSTSLSYSPEHPYDSDKVRLIVAQTWDFDFPVDHVAEVHAVLGEFLQKFPQFKQGRQEELS